MPDYTVTAKKNGDGSDLRVTVFDVVNGTVDGLPWAEVRRFPGDEPPIRHDLEQHDCEYHYDFEDPDDELLVVEAYVRFEDVLFPIKKAPQIEHC